MNYLLEIVYPVLARARSLTLACIVGKYNEFKLL